MIIAALAVCVAPSAAAAADASETAPADEAPAADEQPSVTVDPSSADAQPPAVISVAPPTPVTPVVSPAPRAPPTVAATATGTPGPLRRERHGLALLGGLGIAYGGLGLQARYDLPIARGLTVSPFVSSGLFFGWRSGPVGVSATLGARHRFAVDLGLAPLGHSGLVLHGTDVADRVVFGPLVAAGYEHMSDGGWLQRTTIEYGYAAWGTAVPIATPGVLFGGLAVGRRIW